MSTTIGSTSSLSQSYTQNSYVTASATPSLAQTLADDATATSQASTSVTLSAEAKAYLAALADNTATVDVPAATLAADARKWFDQQYKTLGITSAQLDGQTAVDLSGQSRATLSAIASNTGGLFSPDETAAAADAMQARFNTAVAPHVVIARHTGDYASLYDAALKYMDGAGADERATVTWQNQRAALVEGQAAARSAFGKAPDTGNADDPVHALLAKTTASGAPASDASTESVAANARAMLDDQVNAAKDAGKELVFDRARKTGQQADLSKFDNRSLAAIALNTGASFSAEEVRAAKHELNARNRATTLDSLNQGNGSLALLQQQASMSDEEKAALGVTERYTNSLIQSYRSMLSMQDMLSARATTSMTSYV